VRLPDERSTRVVPRHPGLPLVVLLWAVLIAAPARTAAQAPGTSPAPGTTSASPGRGQAGRGPALPRVPAWEAQPRTDENSRIAHQELLAKRTQGRIDIYFAGDSIARRWGATDYPELLANWKENFRGWNAANFAWGADRTQNILWRLQNGELDGVNPKVIVLLAGTNNIGRQPGTQETVTEITRGIEAILRLMREKAPAATIILTAIFPRNDNIAVMPTITAINERLATLADGNTIRFLNVNDKMADANGRLFDGVMNPDGLHPSLEGYQIWADALKPIFTELLGPPAATDLAPPPTGDPSSRLR
jgi:lysophospholipase L1-like esterase